MTILKSELIKLLSIRSTWIYLALITAVGGTAAILHSWSVRSFDETSDIGWNVLTVGADFALLVMIFAAAGMVGTDLSHKTVTWSYLADNRRVGHLVVQVAVVVGAVVFSGVLGVLLAGAGNLVSGIGMNLGFTATALTPVTAALVQWVVFSTLSALFAIILRSGMLGAMIVLADFFVIEVMLGIAGVEWLRPVLDLLPLANSRILGIGEFNGINHGPVTAAVILMLTLGLVGVCAAWRVDRGPVR